MTTPLGRATLFGRVGSAWAFAACALLLLGLPGAAKAQFRGGGFERPSQARAIVAGARAGFDFQADSPVLGGYLRTALFNRFSVQGSAEATFLDGLTEKQFTAELLAAIGPGLRLGAGPVWRNTVYDAGASEAGVKETRLGYSIVALIGGSAGPGRTITGIEFRFTSVSEFSPRTLSLQIGVPLARW